MFQSFTTAHGNSVQHGRNKNVGLPAEYARLMDDRKPTADGMIGYQEALRRFESGFEACKRLPDDLQVRLLKEIGKRLVQKLTKIHSEEQKSVQVIGVQIKSDD